MSKVKSSNNRTEILVGEIPEKRNGMHLHHQVNYKGTGFIKSKKKKLFRKRKHKQKGVLI